MGESARATILVLRLWIEHDARERFRARIMQTFDSTGREQAIATASDPDDVSAVIQTWVEVFVDQQLGHEGEAQVG